MSSGLPQVKEWAEIIAINKNLRESPEKKSIEYRKGSLEISKIIITNLHLLNAGGIVGLPAISALYGISSMEGRTRVIIIGVPVVLYTLGLLAATLCALATYFNYSRWAEYHEVEEEESLLRFEPLLPNANTKERSAYRASRFAEIPAEKSAKLRSINRTFIISHIAYCRLAVCISVYYCYWILGVLRYKFQFIDN